MSEYGVWLDSQLKFTSHINERVRRARTAEIQIRGLTKIYDLVPGLVRRIQPSVVQSTALYGAEVWWRGQKNHERTIQQIINRQARSITGMYPSTPIHPLLCEAGLVLASTLLNYRQRQYALRLLSLPDQHPTKEILPISLRKGDAGSQPGQLPENTFMWTENARPTLYEHWLAWPISYEHSIDPADGVEPVEIMEVDRFSGKIVIQPKKNALEEARKYRAGLVMWTDGSKLDHGTGRVGAAVCWKEKTLDSWKEKSVFLGRNKEILDAELWAILEALDIAAKETRNMANAPVTIFCDSQEALRAIEHPPSHKRNRFLRGSIYEKTKKLESNKHHVTIRWIPSHSGLVGNERADKAAKNRAERGGQQTERWSSLAHIRKNLVQARSQELTNWHEEKKQERENSRRGYYIPWKEGINSTLANAPKKYASRYYQLKVGHGAVGTYLAKIGAIDTPQCWWCDRAEQTVEHLYTECRRWRKERRKLMRTLCKEVISCQGWTDKKRLAELLANKKAIGPILGFLKSTEVGKRDGARERENEW